MSSGVRTLNPRIHPYITEFSSIRYKKGKESLYLYQSRKTTLRVISINKFISKTVSKYESLKTSFVVIINTI